MICKCQIIADSWTWNMYLETPRGACQTNLQPKTALSLLISFFPLTDIPSSSSSTTQETNLHINQADQGISFGISPSHFLLRFPLTLVLHRLEKISSFQTLQESWDPSESLRPALENVVPPHPAFLRNIYTPKNIKKIIYIIRHYLSIMTHRPNPFSVTPSYFPVT